MLTAFLKKAVEESADALEFEYKDDELLVMAYHAHMGVGIGRVKSNSAECRRLIDEIIAFKRKKRVRFGDQKRGVRVSTDERFGETAWRIDLSEIA